MATRRPSPPPREHLIVAVLKTFQDAAPWMRVLVLALCFAFALALVSLLALHPVSGAVAGGGGAMWAVGRFFGRW